MKPRSGDKCITKNPVRDSITITDRKCGESVANAVFRRTVYPLYNQPQSGLHKINTPVQPSRVEAVWWWLSAGRLRTLCVLHISGRLLLWNP